MRWPGKVCSKAQAPVDARAPRGGGASPLKRPVPRRWCAHLLKVPATLGADRVLGRLGVPEKGREGAQLLEAHRGVRLCSVRCCALRATEEWASLLWSARRGCGTEQARRICDGTRLAWMAREIAFCVVSSRPRRMNARSGLMAGESGRARSSLKPPFAAARRARRETPLHTTFPFFNTFFGDFLWVQMAAKAMMYRWCGAGEEKTPRG